ncbi:MAG: diguanylate cyclase, partial [Mobilitalea sp.]
MNETNYMKIYKKLIHRFVIASLLLLFVFLLKQFIINYQIAQEENISYVINVSGRQRMLSQKIVKDILLIQPDQSTVNELYIKDMKESIELWKNSHYELLELNETEEFLQNDHNAIFQMYETLEPTFLIMVNSAEHILQVVEKEDRDSHQIDLNIQEIIENETEYLEQMDSIVSRYEMEARQSVELIKITHKILFIIIIGILIFIIFIIFIPMLNYLKNAFWQVNESNKNFMKMFQTMKGSLFVIKKDGEILFMNGDAERISNKDKDTNEILYLSTSVNWLDFNIIQLIEKVIKDDSRIEGIEAIIEDREGNILTVVISAVSGSYNGYEAVMVNLFDMTVQKKAEASLKNIAIKDELTGLYNRHFLESIVEEEFERAQRYEIPLSAALLDLDHFKKVNDQWGHPVGDSVLQFTADIVKKHIRKSDYAIRIGGEEFLILMPNSGSKGALATAEKVRKALEEETHPIAGKITASFGVAERIDGEDYHNLYSRIDEALYQAKESGRNRVVKAQSVGAEYAAVSFKWNQSWNCGEKYIDQQHRELF